MLEIFKKIALVPKGLRYKLLLAFSLMSVIPLLVCMYLVSVYIFPRLDNVGDISIVVMLSITVAILGLIFAKGLVDPVVGMALDARRIASGEYDKKIAIVSDDEVGEIGDAINTMTQRIKSNLDELKDYGQKTKEINTEIHKKVLALSSLLQIGEIISTSSMELDAILELIVQKAATVFEDGFGILFLDREMQGKCLARLSCGIEGMKMAGQAIETGKGLLGKALAGNSVFVMDDSSKKSADLESLREEWAVKNLAAVPLYPGKKVLGLLVLGNHIDDYRFKTDDIDLVKVFAKQITIAIENDILIKRTEELTIKDDLTGLYNKSYILARLEEEIKRAIFYQRPCSFLIFNIDDFNIFREARGELAAEDIVKKVAKIVKDNTDPVGKAARIGGDEFAMLLPEKNKKEAMYIAENVRKAVESASFLKDQKAALSVSGGVSENPIDGATNEELFKKASDALRRAKALGKNRVEA